MQLLLNYLSKIQSHTSSHLAVTAWQPAHKTLFVPGHDCSQSPSTLRLSPADRREASVSKVQWTGEIVRYINDRAELKSDCKSHAVPSYQ